MIKVLMMESPYDPLPSEQAEVIDELDGKVFIDDQAYTGSLELIKDRNGLYIINKLPFEEYVAGVVASETGQDWEVEALKAQAVISRTYATYYRQLNDGNDFHLTSSILHQLYKGKNTDPLITFTVSATAGEILTYDNMPIKAFFHATCKGRTEVPEEIWQESFPYLLSVKCNSKNAPYDTWQRRFSRTDISGALGTGELRDISISSYTATGRVKTLKLVMGKNKSDKSVIEVKATDLRKHLGYKDLPSTQFTVSKKGQDIVFAGRGYGHGVGLSQWGALEMAKQGKNYREILTHFYPGTTLKDSRDITPQSLAFKSDKGTK